jgi:hypothetical protein
VDVQHAVQTKLQSLLPYQITLGAPFVFTDTLGGGGKPTCAFESSLTTALHTTAPVIVPDKLTKLINSSFVSSPTEYQAIIPSLS